ncbi:MAG: glycosyltransferase, partial [Chloroflexota bacterium]
MRLYRTKKYGVVQVHNLPDFLVFCAWWPKLRGAKIILDIHDVMPEFFAERSGKSLDHFFVKVIIWQEQRACRFADQVITVTEPWRQALVKRGVPFEKTNVVMNVPDGGMFYRGVQPNPGTKADDQVNLIYHGVQAPRHGLDMILHAVNQLRDELPHLHFILHGNGDAHLDLKALAKALDLEDRVQFTSTFMSIDELPKFIMRGDIGVVPYHDDIFSGGILPTKVLEYVALGLPVITSQTPAIEAYFNEEMVEMFAPGDLEGLKERIVKLYHDTARRQQLVIQSEDFLKQYGWEVQTEGYTAMVNQLNQS